MARRDTLTEAYVELRVVGRHPGLRRFPLTPRNVRLAVREVLREADRRDAQRAKGS